MTVRATVPMILLACVLSAWGAPSDPAAAIRDRFVCKRKGFAVIYAPPAGWTGPVYAGGDALDSWTFSSGPAPVSDSLETRIYDAKDSLIRWDKASKKEILATFQGGYVNPHVERIATLPLDGHATAVYAVHSDGIEELLANVYHGDSLVSVMCTSATPEGTARQRAGFLAFLRSLRFEKWKE